VLFVEIDELKIFFLRPRTLPQIWSQMVVPAFATLLRRSTSVIFGAGGGLSDE
jgi:hypothetical protein